MLKIFYTILTVNFNVGDWRHITRREITMAIPLSERLVYLRKERGLSQKQAAMDLGISQALLSHYERGIRECGLEFLVRCAEYYHVSCDYLLGRTMEKNSDIPALAVPQLQPMVQSESEGAAQAVQMLLDIAAQCHSQPLDNCMSDYFYLTTYKLFRIFYESGNYPRGFLALPAKKFPYAVDAQITMCEAEIRGLLTDEMLTMALPTLTHDELLRRWPRSASALLHALHVGDTLAGKQEYLG